MKILILLLILGFLGFSSCFERGGAGKTTVHTNTEIVSVLVDHTDKFISLPDITSIRSLYTLDSDHAKGAVFKLSEIEDIEYTPTVQLSIEPQSLLMQNPGERESAIKTFFSNVNASLIKLQSQPSEKPLSEIYPVIAREANTVAAMNGVSKRLVVFSDLRENTPTFSVYRKSDQDELYNNPDSVAAQFQNAQTLNNLSGLTVYLVYQAKNYNDSRLFGLISSLYVKMFEAKGATVIITANL